MNFVIYGKPDCQFCNMAKQLLEMRGQDFKYLTLDEDYSLDHLQAVVVEKTGVPPRTFPQILVQEDADVDYKYVGGFTELREFMAQIAE